MLLKWNAPVYQPARNDCRGELTRELTEQGFAFQ